MTFKWKIVRPPFHQATEGVEVMHPGIELEFETGSLDEAHGIFQDSGSALGEMFGAEIMTGASNIALALGGAGGNTEAQGEQTDGKPPRKPRGPNKPKNIEAVAPDPIVIPSADAPPTAPGPLDDGIPEALRRAPLPPVPPNIAPPAPPAPPAAPPTGVLAGKIAAELDKRATGAADGGQALADWLATSGITVKGATYAEAVTVLRLQADEKLGPIATALGVA